MQETITPQEKTNEFLRSGLQNLRTGLDDLTLEKFIINTMARRMDSE